ncbi:MAG: hypothetical protein DMD94_10055 [Candidatus Rokuibacteriota bacterium]|nr:MAG: hypothetical protein DMD94_10055 [Candidatus Rokubacteria bacterium]
MRSSPSRRIFARRPGARQARDSIRRERGPADRKGLLAGGLGLWLATIGLDPVTGIQRYTFGQLFLCDGIGVVPVTIGFYAIPELIGRILVWLGFVA